MAIKTESIDYAHESVALQGFIAYDDAVAAKRPGVLVCHEWWGLNDYPKRRATQIATEMGYVAFALDMYGKGVVADNHEQAGKLMNALLSNPQAKARVQAGLDVLRHHPRVNPDRVAAIGYCMGGSMAVHMARAGMALRGVVSFHGTLSAEKTSPGAIKASILVCTGADDPMMPPDKLIAFEDEMGKANADWQVIVYGGARHAFTNPSADSKGLPPLKYDARADRRSWQAMKDFLAEVLA
jgi:dienelactone hydrolase